MALIRNNMEGAQSRRRRGDDGRYMEGGGYPRRSAYDAYNEYGGARQEYDMAMDDEMYDSPEARRMGFARSMSASPGRQYASNNHGEAPRGSVTQMRQLQHGQNSPMRMMGMGKPQPLTRERAEEWVESMQGKGDKPGETWTYEEIEELAEKHDIPEKKLVDFYAVMNMLASDYYEVAEKFDVLNDDFFVCMAKAFIEDKDAVKDKTAAYYQYIVKKS